MEKIYKFKLSILRDIGWSHWDPIVLLPAGETWEQHPEFVDEYDSYLMHVAGQIVRGVERNKLIKYLSTVESEALGLGFRKGLSFRAEKTIDELIVRQDEWVKVNKRKFMHPKGNIPISKILDDIRASISRFQAENPTLFDIDYLQYDENLDPIEPFDHPDELEGRELNYIDLTTCDKAFVDSYLTRGIFRQINFQSVTVQTVGGQVAETGDEVLLVIHRPNYRKALKLTELEIGFCFLSQDGNVIDFEFWDKFVTPERVNNPSDYLDYFAQYEKRFRPFEGASVSIEPKELERIGSMNDFVSNLIQRLLGQITANPKQVRHDVDTVAVTPEANEPETKTKEPEATANMSAPQSFDPDAYYRPQDPVMRQIATVQTLATWRMKEKNLPWTDATGRILYKGQDIIDFLEAGRIEAR